MQVVLFEHVELLDVERAEHAVQVDPELDGGQHLLGVP